MMRDNDTDIPQPSLHRDAHPELCLGREFNDFRRSLGCCRKQLEDHWLH